MTKRSLIVLDDGEWEMWEYDHGDIIYQRACHAEGCIRGILLAPARICPRCSGSGFETKSGNEQKEPRA